MILITTTLLTLSAAASLSLNAIYFEEESETERTPDAAVEVFKYFEPVLHLRAIAARAPRRNQQMKYW